ncbi:membrane-associated protein, putative [Bodo saltans]|uniref:Membrane-associated protein, putative n=1 Tax=Bodo saltans TaxID=75058 RepID=A0A0S4JJB4_BODSA|nr:membrane-associated protein, putative [Bodo saltans]|eukprot:CUG89093.1 membrane-associated protein, putative [Bodo saltans]
MRRASFTAATMLSSSSSISSGVMSLRSFGNAPARVRPGEEPPTYQWTQAPRETSAILVISSMFIVPMCMIVLWEDDNQRKKRATMEWAQAYDASADPWKRRVPEEKTATYTP